VFERFTEQARHVVVLAQDEARQLRHPHIGTEHLLLALLRDEHKGIAAQLLQSFDLTVEGVYARLWEIAPPGEGPPTSGQIPFTPPAKRVLEGALRETQSLGQNNIGTERLLLGLLHESEGLAVRILRDCDVDPEQVRTRVLRTIGAPSGHRAAIHAQPQRIRARPPGLDWRQATTLWRPEGLELRVPLHLTEGAMAAFAADDVWTQPPLPGLRREIWDGWLALASPTLLDDIDPVALRGQLDPAVKRAIDGGGPESARAEDFLRRLRSGDPIQDQPADEP
jgi:hypothetical protein